MYTYLFSASAQSSHLKGETSLEVYFADANIDMDGRSMIGLQLPTHRIRSPSSADHWKD